MDTIAMLVKKQMYENLGTKVKPQETGQSFVDKRDFPLLWNEKITYLDSAATSQKPSCVIDELKRYYEHLNANVHRGVYALAQQATSEYEEARITIGKYIGAANPVREVVFTRNATEGFNLLANSLRRSRLKNGGKVVLSLMEHHANIVPWQIISEVVPITIEFAEIDENGLLDLRDLDKKASGATIISLTMTSNVLGTINPIEEIASIAKKHHALLALDAAQFAPHAKTKVTRYDVDFLALTGHKMLGPTGVGVFYAKEELLEEFPPFFGGGEMISDVTTSGFKPNEIPWKFEAGTPPIAEAIGLKRAVEYLNNLDEKQLREFETCLIAYQIDGLKKVFGNEILIYGPNDVQLRAPLISFQFADIHPHDISQVLDSQRICVRAGHHCAKPLMHRLGITATTRASHYLYNNFEDADRLIEGLRAVKRFFS